MKARNKVTGNLETVYVKGRDNTPIGTIFSYPGSTAPTGYLICDGSTFNQSLYPELYEVLGSNTLPDLRGKHIMGYDNSQTEFNTLGKTGGEKAHTMTLQELVNHYHTMPGGIVQYSTSPTFNIGEGPHPGIYNDNMIAEPTGSSQPFNVLDPYFVCNYIIKAYHTNLSSSSDIVNEHSNSSENAYSCTYMNSMLEAQNLNWTADYTYLENVSSAYRIGNLAIISLTVKSNWTGIGKTLLNLTDYNFANSGMFAINAYNGVDGEIYVDVNSDRIGANISNNIGYGKVTIIATITPKN